MLSSSYTAVSIRFFFFISPFANGPPISEPATRPKVAAAVAKVVAPSTFISSSKGPNAPAVPCPPIIDMEPVHIPISGFIPRSFESPTATKF